ncbi:MAG: MucB/RseB C-terminal domain-containing protein [Gallionella sp.]|nr:MucB/RseB C-terminal domain-containing protein [Gallionella sp.]
MRLPVVLLVLFLPVSPACAGDAQVGLDWLKTVAFAAHQTDYSGTFVYQYDNRVETSRITHVTLDDGEYERLERLDGPKREIIRHHGQVWSFMNHKMVQMNSSSGKGIFPALLPEQLAVLSANYTPKSGAVERIAGYNAQLISFQPKDTLRYVKKVWAHTDSGLPLKFAVVNEQGKTVEQYAFTELKIGDGIDRSWIAASGTAVAGAASKNKSALSQNVVSGWTVDALPSGFKKTMEVLRPMRGKHASVTQMVFSDGLSAISVFIEPSDNDEDDVAGLSSRGAVNLYHNVVDNHLITVVGEVPPRTVMQVFDSVRFRNR